MYFVSIKNTSDLESNSQTCNETLPVKIQIIEHKNWDQKSQKIEVTACFLKYLFEDLTPAKKTPNDLKNSE